MFSACASHTEGYAEDNGSFYKSGVLTPNMNGRNVLMAHTMGGQTMLISAVVGGRVDTSMQLVVTHAARSHCCFFRRAGVTNEGLLIYYRYEAGGHGHGARWATRKH